MRKGIMSVTRFLHGAILVTDLEQADHFYGTVLGLDKVSRDLNFPGSWYQIGETQIHLIVAGSVPDPLVDPARWGRNAHLALAVSQLEAMQERLERHQVAFQRSASGRAALFARDPDGNVIELSQVEGSLP